MSRRDSDSEKVPAALYDRLTDTPTYAARMYKVQIESQVRRPSSVAVPNEYQSGKTGSSDGLNRAMVMIVNFTGCLSDFYSLPCWVVSGNRNQ